MLKTLSVKNYILLDELELELGRGLTALTGETGAGKSILIGALSAVLGESMGRDVLRANADRVIIEAGFTIPPLAEISALAGEYDLALDSPDILIRREMSSTGRSRCFIDDSPVPVSALKRLGDLLVDLHGQHEHQSLLRPGRHLDLLDEYAGSAGVADNVKRGYNHLKQVEVEIAQLKERAARMAESRELCRFQLKEIDAFDPQPGEEEALQREERILQNAERLFRSSRELFQRLYESEGSISEQLSAAHRELLELAGIDATFEELSVECSEIKIVLDEMANTLQRYSNRISYNADRLEQVRQRLDGLNGLKKKYGGTIDAIVEKRSELKNTLSRMGGVDDRLSELEAHYRDEFNKLKNIALALSRERVQAGVKLSEQVSAELSRLGMSKAKFTVSTKYNQGGTGIRFQADGRELWLNSKGIDEVEFLITVNPGEPQKPLAAVASGGEISRIMLAIKSLLADIDRVPVLIFDEIDIGISGRVAQDVGRKLRQLSQSHQVMCITHLPQIASMAQHHFLVEKKGDEKETRTLIRKLSGEERTEQIARLFGGQTVSEAHLLSASELMQEAERRARDDEKVMQQ